MMNRLLSPSVHFSQRTNLPTAAGTLQSDFLRVLVFRNDPQKVTRAPVERLTDAVCYATKWLKSSLEKLFGNSG